MDGDPNFFLRKFVQLNLFLRKSYKNRGVYVQNTWLLSWATSM